MATIIFDFDGTIADSFDFVLDLLVAAAGQPPISGLERQEYRGMSMVAIGRQFGLSWWRLFRIFMQGRRKMAGHIMQVQPFEGMPDVIRKVHGEGHELFILTSNTVRTVHKFLHHYDLHTYFLEIYAGVSLFGKAPALRRLLKEQHLDLKDALYVGDELRDVEAAQALGMRVIATTWGFARPSDLADLQPTGVAANPQELLALLEEI